MHKSFPKYNNKKLVRRGVMKPWNKKAVILLDEKCHYTNPNYTVNEYKLIHREKKTARDLFESLYLIFFFLLVQLF